MSPLVVCSDLIHQPTSVRFCIRPASFFQQERHVNSKETVTCMFRTVHMTVYDGIETGGRQKRDHSDHSARAQPRHCFVITQENEKTHLTTISQTMALETWYLLQGLHEQVFTIT